MVDISLHPPYVPFMLFAYGTLLYIDDGRPFQGTNLRGSSEHCTIAHWRRTIKKVIGVGGGGVIFSLCECSFFYHWLYRMLFNSQGHDLFFFCLLRTIFFVLFAFFRWSLNRKKFDLLFRWTTFQVSAQPGTSGTTCRWNQLTILHPAGTECVDCPECPEGFGLDPQCGSRITSGVTVECVACQEGKSYSDKHDLSSCKPCTICDPNEETISPCTATKNAVCGKCKPG